MKKHQTLILIIILLIALFPFIKFAYEQWNKFIPKYETKEEIVSGGYCLDEKDYFPDQDVFRVHWLILEMFRDESVNKCFCNNATTTTCYIKRKIKIN